MTNTPQYQRPNTVAGLIEKHKELSGLRERYKAEIKKLIVDMEHLDAAMRLFDPNSDTYVMKSYVTKPRANRGSLKRFVLTCFREANGPLTSREITVEWAEDRGLAADEATYATLRRRIGACIKGCVSQGIIENVGWTKHHGENGPYKLWQLKEGGP